MHPRSFLAAGILALTLSSFPLCGALADAIVTTNSTEAMRIDSSGKVGIGTTSPAGTLDVEGGTAASGNGSSIKIVAQNGYTSGNTNGGNIILMPGANNSSGTYGYLGIGTTTPTSPVYIYDLTGTSPTVLITQYSDYNSARLGLKASYNGGTWILSAEGFNLSDVNNLNFNFNGSTKVAFTSGGNVGIGTTGPSYTLHVNGSVAGTSAYNNLSDIRLKKDVITIGGALDMIGKLRGVRFRWRLPEERTIGKDYKLPLDDSQVGFIAQEVKPVLPEAITQSSAGVFSIEESKIVPVLVEAVKEQQQEMNDLKATNAALEARLDALESRSTPSR